MSSSTPDGKTAEQGRARTRPLLLTVMFLPFCWLAMMTCHEVGHVVAAAITGGTVTEVVLHPLAISRTDVAPNPYPIVVVWAGPIVGSLLPLVIWGALYLARIRETFLARFFAGFALVANGAYIGVGSFERIGDAGTMLRHGTPLFAMWLFGLVTIPAGFLVWNGQAKDFGFGLEPNEVSRRSLVTACLLLTVTLVVMSFFG